MPPVDSVEERAAPVTLTLQEGVPLQVSPDAPGVSLGSAFDVIRPLVDQRLERDGGILFRGFTDPGVEGFQTFAAGFGHPLLNYEFGSTPRTRVTGGGVYTSTEYPAHRTIPLHNEQAYTREWPLRIWFYSAQVAQSGGETPIADSREIYRRIDPMLRRRFDRLGLKYVRNYGGGLDVDWQQVFNSNDPRAVETWCRERGIECLWSDGGHLRTSQVCQATAVHPRTGDLVWFNQAHLFHVSALEPELREILLETVGEESLPRNVYYGNGQPLEETALEEVRGVLDECKVVFPWQRGDVLMLDNMLMAHAREPYTGARKVVVAMAESHGTPPLNLGTTG